MESTSWKLCFVSVFVLLLISELREHAIYLTEESVKNPKHRSGESQPLIAATPPCSPEVSTVQNLGPL